VGLGSRWGKKERGGEWGGENFLNKKKVPMAGEKIKARKRIFLLRSNPTLRAGKMAGASR